MGSHNTGHLVSGFSHSARWFRGSSALYCASGPRSSLWLNNIPLSIYTAFCLSMYLLMDGSLCSFIILRLGFGRNYFYQGLVIFFLEMWSFTAIHACCLCSDRRRGGGGQRRSVSTLSFWFEVSLFLRSTHSDGFSR